MVRELYEAQGVQEPRVERKAILADFLLYGWSDGPESNSLEVLIHRLRQKIGSARIATVRNIGYRVVA